MSDVFTVNIEEVAQSFTVALQEAQNGASGANGISPQLRATGTTLEASGASGWQPLIELSTLPFLPTSGGVVGGPVEIGGNTALGANLEAFGTSTFYDHVSLEGQSAASGTSAMNRALCDARYLKSSGSGLLLGQLELSGQSATTPASAMNRTLVDRRLLNRFSQFTRIDPAMGWTANAAINGSSTYVSSTLRGLAVTASTGAASEAYLRTSSFQPIHFTYPGNDVYGSNCGIDWRKPTYFSFRPSFSHASNAPPLPSSEAYIRFGNSRSNVTYGALAAMGIGVKFSSGDILPMVHNGSAITTGASIYSTASALSPMNLIEIIGNGSGTFEFYINDHLGATLTGGPTGFGGQENTAVNLMCRNLSSGANTNCSLSIGNAEFYFGYLC